MLLVSGIVSSNTLCVITTIFSVITMIWFANRFVDQLVLILGGTLGHTLCRDSHFPFLRKMRLCLENPLKAFAVFLRQRNEFLPFAESAR